MVRPMVYRYKSCRIIYSFMIKDLIEEGIVFNVFYPFVLSSPQLP